MNYRQDLTTVLIATLLLALSACSQSVSQKASSAGSEAQAPYDPENFAGLNKTTIPNNHLSRNKLQNPSFEQGTLMWSTMGVGNTRTVELEHDRDWFSIDRETAYHGKQSARLQVWDNRKNNYLNKYDQWQQELVNDLAKKGLEPTIHNPYVISFHALIKPNTNYTLSFYAKAEYPGQELSVFAMPNYRDWNRHKSVRLTKDWQRYSFSFQAERPEIAIAFGQDYRVPSPKEMPAKSYYWVDAFQLEENSMPTEFTQKPIVIDLTDTERRVSVEDKKIVSGSIANFDSVKRAPTIRLEVKDYFDRTLHTQIIKAGTIASESRKPFTVDLTDIPNLDNVGLYTLRFTINGSAEDSLYKDLEVFRYVILDPTAVKDIRNADIFGWGSGILSNHEQSVALYKDLGFGLYINNSDNNMDQEFVDLWKTTEAPVLYNVYGRWSKNLETRKMATATDEQMDMLVKDVVQNLKRFPDLKYIKIVNEPEHGWKNSFMYDPKQLVPYMKKLYRALKASNPDYVVVSPDLANIFQGNLDWMEMLFRLGGGEAFDVLSIHTYQPTPEDPSLDRSLQKLIDMADRYNFDGTIWLTEGGHYLMETYPAHNLDALQFEGHFETKMPGFTEDVYGQKSGLALGLRTLLAVMKHGERITGNTEWGWSGLGVNVLQNMPMDHAVGYHAMAKRLGNVTFSEELSLADTVKAYAFKRDDGSVSLAVWDYDMNLAKGLRQPRALITSAQNIRVEELFERSVDKPQAAELTGMPIFYEFKNASEFQTFKNEAYVLFDERDALSIATELTSPNELTLTINNQYHEDIKGTLSLEFNGVSTTEEITLNNRESRSQIIPITAQGGKGSIDVNLALRFNNAAGNTIASTSIEQQVFLARYYNKKIKVDGLLNDWESDLAVSIDSDAEDKDATASGYRFDQKAKVFSGWSDTHLFFAFEVHDDVHRQLFSGGDMWQQDSVQLFLDTFNDGAKGDVKLEDDYAWLLGKGAKGDQAYLSYVPSWQNAFLTPGLADAADIAIKRDEQRGVTTYELAIGRANFLPLNLEPNKILGMGVFINDADSGDRENYSYNTGGEPAWMNPSAYPKLLLVK